MSSSNKSTKEPTPPVVPVPPRAEDDSSDEALTPFGAQFIVENEGRVEIGEDVIARIAGIASTEVHGVTLEGKFNLSDLITRKTNEIVRGLSVERSDEDNTVHISATVRMEYGQDMYETAVRFRRHIKDTVEKMTRLRVKAVDIKIVGITLPPEIDDSKAQMEHEAAAKAPAKALLEAVPEDDSEKTDKDKKSKSKDNKGKDEEKG